MLDSGTARKPNRPSCGNQPAHIKLTTRRHRHARHHHAHPVNEAVSTATVVDTASPRPLDKPASISGGCTLLSSVTFDEGGE
jgi:hypothetical protein